MASRYTPEQRERALDLYREHGPREAARQTGVPASTITTWASRSNTSRTFETQKTQAATETLKTRAEQVRSEIRLLLVERAQDALKLSSEASSLDMKNYATAAAILLDKYRLEVGEATSRSEVHERSDLDRDIEKLVAEFQGPRTQLRGTSPGGWSGGNGAVGE